MEYVSLRDTLKNNLPGSQNSQEPVNEFLLTLGAIALCSFVAAPLFNTEFFKSIGAGIGGVFSGIGAVIGSLGRKNKNKGEDSDDDKKPKKRNNKDDSDDEDSTNNRPRKFDVNKITPEQSNAMMQNMFAIAQEKLDDEKDENEKKKAQGLLDVARACSVDKDGNPISFEKFGERLKEVTGMDPEEYKKSIGFKEPTQDEFNKIQEELKKSLEGKSAEELQKITEENTKKAQEASKKIDEARKANEADQKELNDIKDELEKINDSDDSDEDKKKKREELEKKAKNIADRVAARSINAGLGAGETNKSEPEPNKSEPEPNKSEPNKEELRKKLDARKEELKKQQAENEKRELAEKYKKSAEELQKKIDDATAAAERAADENNEEEFDKQMKLVDKFQQARQKQIEAHSVEKDEDGNIVKDEEIDDPNNPGKKIKVKTHTGPRGGKFYYPEGSPKDAEHRVYIKEDDDSLSSWLYYKLLLS